jgi:hypothetical protein
MKKILKLEYALWWLILASLIIFKFMAIGNAENSLFNTPTYLKYGIIFKVIVILLWSSVFGTLLNWLFSKIFKKLNEEDL